MSRNQRRNRRNKSGSSQTARNASRASTGSHDAAAVLPRSSTETKSSLKTTELIAYAAAVLAVVMTALAVDDDGQGGGTDPFGAESAIRYITYLTIGYMVARGLAKSGSYEIDGGRDTAHDIDDDVTPRAHETDDEDVRDDVVDVDGEAEVVDTDVAPAPEVEHAGTGTTR